VISILIDLAALMPLMCAMALDLFLDF